MDKDILELEHDISILGSKSVTNNYFINPKKMGQTEVIFSIYSLENFPEEKVIDNIKYLFKVNEDLTVNYEEIS